MDAAIRDLEPADRPAVTALMDDAVGAGFWGFSDGPEGLALVAVTPAGVAGAMLARLAPADDADARTAGVAAPGGPGAQGSLILHMRAVGVAPEARRRGLAKRLLAAAEAEAAGGGARAAFLYAWLPAGQPEPVAVRFYEAAGYRARPDIHDFYAEGSLASGALCPYCGPPPCRCAARPYVKELPTSEAS